MNSYSFLTIGKTQESTDAAEGFKRYVGVGSSYVIAVNPTKKELEAIYGREQTTEPEYAIHSEEGDEARITFIVKTDADANNGIEIINRAVFTLRNVVDANSEQTKVRVLDDYGNYAWANINDAKEGKKLLSSEGKELKIDSKYHIACSGEIDLVNFLKIYLRVPNIFKYVNGSWIKSDNANDGLFKLEHIRDYFKGDFSEIKEAIALQPNNKVKLLYGVRTSDEGKQYQTVATRNGLVLPNNAGPMSLEKLKEELDRIKNSGAFSNTDYKVCDLQEWTVEPTNLESTPTTDMFDTSELPWS